MSEEKQHLEERASRLIDAWVALHGRPIPWAKAVEIVAIITKMPESERLRLLALDDVAGKATGATS